MPMRPHPADPHRLYRRISRGPLLEVFLLDGRSHRGANPLADAPGAPLLGATQRRWLEGALIDSRASWKVVASGQPLGLQIPDTAGFEGVGTGPGEPRGREEEVATLLRTLHEARVRNVVWITGDVHYAAAHHYHPDRARFRQFTPVWELVAGPLHAGTFTGGALDDTFGPEVRFCAVPPDLKPNRPPSDGRQYFGTLRVSEGGRRLTARLHDREGNPLFTQELPAEG
jgi:alkaline phosphatase D